MNNESGGVVAAAGVNGEAPGGERMPDAALAYAKRFGFAVFPCKPHGKEPLTKHGCKDATQDPKQIAAWCKRWPKANIGIATGKASGIVCLDVDAKTGGRETLAILEDENGRLPEAPTVLTGGGGLHIYFRDPGGVRNSASAIGAGLDVRGDGGYVIAPPSIHPNGTEYRWELSSSANDIPMPEFPAWLLKLIKTRPDRRFHTPEKVAEGKRNETLYKLGRSLKARGISEPEIAAALDSVNQQRCVPPLGEREVREIAHSAATNPDRVEFRDQSSNGARPAADGAALADDWPEPELVACQLLPVPQLTSDMIPAPLRAWTGDVADRFQCPLDYLAPPMVVAAGMLMGRKVSIRPKERDDWHEYPNLWAIVVGHPGMMKSPALNEALKPLRRIEREARERYQGEMQDQGWRKANAEAALGRIQEEIRKRAKAGRSTDDLREEMRKAQYAEPPERRYIASDATGEKLAALLIENPNGLLLVRDELSQLLWRLESEEHQSERGFYLETWSGKEPIRVDRIGRGSLSGDAACLGIVGGTTPGTLDSFVRSVYSGERNDGMLQRFQLAVYPDTPGPFTNVDRAPNHDARDRVYKLFVRLDSMQADDFSARDDDEGNFHLRFDGAAQPLFNHWRERLEARVRDQGEHPVLVSHLAKYRKLVPSLALIFHAIDLADGEGAQAVGAEALSRAVAWAEYLEAHARRIYQGAIQPAEMAAAVLARRITQRDFPEIFTIRDISRKHWVALNRKETIVAALEVLEEAGHVRREPAADARFGRPTERFRVNPKVRG